MGTTVELPYNRPASAYRALADLLSLQTHDVSQAVSELASLPCYDSLLKRRDDEATRAVLYWLLNGQTPELKPELERVVGPGFCERGLAKVPACGAFYVADADGTRTALRSVYEGSGYAANTEFRPGCAGISYISQQLSFVAHCMETGGYDLLSAENRELLERSLFDWAPLFARALVGATTHPVLVFAGIKLESVLARPH